ncbi:tRNA-splicing endonuclease subunit sen54 N-term-domain-containing protein [Annulohypoxylon truncatum]|uniref:tRNA-splicing endonuclease subunit sen54 N-term-domain-containing protein n=1 Tax=Annulohypoxylon truncatum TaxID=327061 RepID=UPI0020082D7B|nr:tRNA-splicing endonuclease subunit sen54 N-term-domain-containing protein [Annulohypoxylon truncatum]KAI1214449.1 tRNA-splicing endonuclease subunit sen54 N-term-domain-containing protein [Annulohypoxylon truncatum]
MPFDDEDPTPSSASALATMAGEEEGEAPSLEDALADETQDFRLFASLFDKKGASGKTLRRGEKDFEAHGTRAQAGALEASRDAMRDVLSYTRSHKPKDWNRGWYFPDKWAGAPDGAEEGEVEVEGVKGAGLFARERVVVVEEEIKGPLSQSVGRVVTGIEGYKGTPGWLKTWLLPEEALYLVERGSLDLWWPARGIEDVFPAKKDGQSEAGEETKEFEDYELGVPLSLQAAYALLIGYDGERGKVSLEKYQVYANLRRTGYKIMRATHMPLPPPLPAKPSQNLWQWLISLLPTTYISSQTNPPPFGPLVKPGLYRSYTPIFAQLALIPRHEPTPQPKADTPTKPEEPFNIHYHVWKSSTSFPKTKPPAPDFRIAVADARASSVPTLEQLTALLEVRTPWDPPEESPNQKQGQKGKGNGNNQGLMYKRLKHAWRNAVIAVVDRGLISYVRFGEMAFARERLYEGFGSGAAGGGKGKRGGRSGRGGRGGRGRGRGRGG